MTLDAFGISTTYEILKIAKREGWFGSFRDLFRKKNRALLLGSSGVGKSQFLESINSISATPLSSAQRTEFAFKHSYDVGGALFQLTDTPGQKEHQPRRVRALKDAISSKFDGVINFVAFGYHEYGVPPNVVMNDGVVDLSYAEGHRQKEIDLLAEWAPLIEAEWVITLVTKADIWWDDQEKVLNHYRDGPYGAALKSFLPKANVIVKPYSSISSRFYGKLPNAHSFDDSVRKRIRNEFFHILKESAGALR